MGRGQVYVLGFRDYTPAEHNEEIGKLDVFFGLSYAFNKYEIRKVVGTYANPYLNALDKRLRSRGNDHVPDNIIVMEIPDYGIHEGIYSIIRDEFKAGKRIGFGCHGAHGRTGWVLARLLMDIEKLDGDQAVIQVRKRLCEECVESEKQIENLGCKTETAARVFGGATVGGMGSYGGFGRKYLDNQWNNLDHGDLPPLVPMRSKPADPLVDRPLLADFADSLRARQEGLERFDPKDPFMVYGD